MSWLTPEWRLLLETQVSHLRHSRAEPALAKAGAGIHPDWVRHYDTGISPLRPRPNQVGNLGRHQGLTAITRPLYDAAIPFGLPSEPRTAEMGKPGPFA